MGLHRVGWLVLAVACGKGGEDPGEIDYTLLPIAAGAEIEKVSLNQGAEKVLFSAPGVFSTGRVPPPVLVGRDALVRVGVAPFDDTVEERPVVAVLTVSGANGTETYAEPFVLGDAWRDEDLDSSPSFRINGGLLTPDVTFDVAIREVTFAERTGEASYATWSIGTTPSTATSGFPSPVLDVAATDRITVVIVPIEVDGRLPDTSPGQLAEFKRVFRTMFPVTDAIIEVAPVLKWGQAIGPVSGWEPLLFTLSDMRTQAEVKENTYFYGLFIGADNVDDWCSGGACILGLSLLPQQPTDTWGRASMGVGWSGQLAVDTIVHEVGHAHGREHAPCELFGQPSDPGYPYQDADLGSVGFDIGSNELLAPDAFKDIMGYCKPLWVSDYTFTSLWRQISTLSNLDNARGPQTDWQLVQVHADGSAVLGSQVRGAMASSEGGKRLALAVTRTDGTEVDVSARFVPFDHLPGGLAVMPVQPEAVSVRLR